MLFGIDLNQLLLFPVKDEEARKHFLIGCLVALAGFIVPILPYFLIYGYAIRIAKQVLNNESPHMIAWDDWEGIFKDGAKMFGIRIIYTLPMLILIAPVFFFMIAMPILGNTLSDSQLNTIFPIFMLVIFGCMCLLIPISLPLAVITPAVELYVADKDEFAAGFRVREWWAIFRANISGFIAVLAIYYSISMILGIAIQIVGATFIFACLLPFLFPAMIMYTALIMYASTAQAYKSGKEKLAQMEVNA